MKTTPAQQPTSSSGTTAICAGGTGCSVAEGSDKSTDTVPYKNSFNSIFLNVPSDQKLIWTSPFRATMKDLYWAVPFAVTTGVLIGSDANSMRRVRSNADAISLSKTVSNAGVVGLIGAPAVMYAWGAATGRPRARETGLLTGEASINALIISEAFKLALGRERPTPVNGTGSFFSNFGTDASFPSTHATLAWTAASVISHEYPEFVPQALAYGTAAVVSIARVTGRQHFPSDVVVGGALGWFVGRQVFKARHDQDLDTQVYGDFSTAPTDETYINGLGSPYVPLDSWIYGELDRLAARGFIKSQFLGLKPWTESECRRQLEEADYYAEGLPANSDVRGTIAAIRAALGESPKHRYSASIDQLYARYQQISGTPLRDSYHFGQTIHGDFGRPYDEGVNLITGVEASSIAGPAFFYVAGEYQHAPGRGPLTLEQRQFIASVDTNALLPPNPIDSVDRFYPLDMYAGLNLGQYALSFGKQSVWLAPTQNEPLMLSSNADPMYMLRLARTTPLILPGFLHWIGQISGELIFSKLSGHQFPERPFFNLLKVSFRPTENLEIGFTRAAIWAGVGHPFTAQSLLRSFTSTSDTFSNTLDRNDPGDRKSGFDFNYRIPGLRNWLTIYSDMYSDDDPSPLANPRRAAVNPGIYLSQFPGLRRLDLRGEMSSTQLLSNDQGPDFVYINNQYHDANLNKGFLFGSSVGRDARAFSGMTTYHFTGTNQLQLTFRQLKASTLFLPGGGTQTDATVRARWQARPSVMVDTFVQVERWLIPVLGTRAENNVSGQIELRYTPHWRTGTD